MRRVAASARHLFFFIVCMCGINLYFKLLYYWGVSHPPYTNWEWKPMGFRIGGQDFITLENGKLILATRTYFNRGHCKTALFRGTAEGDWEEIYVLPSDGDTSYPGLLVEGKEVWVSYYASTEQAGKAAIYLAKLPLSLFQE